MITLHRRMIHCDDPGYSLAITALDFAANKPALLQVDAVAQLVLKRKGNEIIANIHLSPLVFYCEL